jgi:hypothetical protein
MNAIIRWCLPFVLLGAACPVLSAQTNEGVDILLSKGRALEATLHQAHLQLIYNHPVGLFAQAGALWTAQDNRAQSPGLPDEDFWQFNLLAGYRFPHRQAEIRLGVLNLTGQDYHLNPLNLTADLPSERTFVASLRFSF